MNPLADAISVALLHSVWQDSVLAVLLWPALAALRRRSPAARYAACCTALAWMVLLPLLTATTHWWGLAPATPPFAGFDASQAFATVPRAIAQVWPGRSTHPAAWLATLQAWALPVWSAGVLLGSLRLIGSGLHASALRKRGDPADEGVRALVARIARRVGIDRPIDVLACAIGDGPATLGWLRPVILLPAAAAMGLTPPQFEAVIAHEIAHIRRHDYLVNLVQMLAETLFFYHPAVWWVSTRVRAERELCCDDLAVASSGDALCFAQRSPSWRDCVWRGPALPSAPRRVLSSNESNVCLE